MVTTGGQPLCLSSLKSSSSTKAVVELVKCSSVASKCSGWCSCKAHNLTCTELCKCEGAEDTCNNVAIDPNSSDDEENEDLMTNYYIRKHQYYI